MKSNKETILIMQKLCKYYIKRNCDYCEVCPLDYDDVEKIAIFQEAINEKENND